MAAVPTAQEKVAAQESHVPATAMQRQHVQEAARNPALSARANGGHPTIAATPRPAAFNAPGVVGARAAGASRPQNAPGAQQHPKQDGARKQGPKKDGAKKDKPKKPKPEGDKADSR